MKHSTADIPEISELYHTLDGDDRTEAVSVILKVRGETCDVDCLYCYEKLWRTFLGERLIWHA